MILGDMRKLTAGLPDNTYLEIKDESTGETYDVTEIKSIAVEDNTNKDYVSFWLQWITQIDVQSEVYASGKKEQDIVMHDELKTMLNEFKKKTIEESMEAAAKAICVGCSYLAGCECTYDGANCNVSKPMLETVVTAMQKLKGEKRDERL